MRKFWSWLGLNLGKHWILVLTIGAVLTVGLGAGITKLEFSTGQDSYLNKSDQVYKDSVAYQDLFGGQAMLTLVTMDKGHDVTELFGPANVRKWQSVEKQVRANKHVLNVVSPLTALQFDDELVKSPSGDPTQSVAGKALLGAAERGEDRSREGRTQRRRGEDALSPQRGAPGTTRLDQHEVGRVPAPRQPGTHSQTVARVLRRRSSCADGHAAQGKPVDHR